MNEKVQQRVIEHAIYTEIQFPQCTRVFTALQGSQNYQMDDAESDVDTKTLIVPSFKEIVFHSKHISTTIEVPPTVEHSDVKDARDMFQCFRKQNINFLEILFTPYVQVNERFKEEYAALYENREAIAHLNPYQCLRAMIGHLMEKYEKFEHPYPTIKWKIDKYGYDSKQLVNMLRIQDFLTRFFEEKESFENCLIPKEKERMKRIKRYALSYGEACAIKERTKLWADEFLEIWRNKLPNKEDSKTSKLLDEILYSIFKKGVVD